MTFYRYAIQACLLATVASMGNMARAQEQKWTHYGLRPLAMGNAYVSVADDYNALFYNPAGLARLKSWNGELFNPYLAISKNTKDFVSSAVELANGKKDSSEAVLDLIQAQSGKNQYAALGLTPHLIFRNFGFGLGAEVSANMVFHRYPSVSIDVGPRLVLPIAFAHNFFEDRLSLGAAVKARIRGGITHEFSIEDIEAFAKNNNNGSGNNNQGPKLDDYVTGGIGYGSDLGLLFTPTKTMEPTLGLSITDIGGTSYDKFNVGGNALGTPDMTLPSVNAGFSLKPMQAANSYLLTSVEAHSINQPFAFSKKFNLGVEWGYRSWFKAQAGLHQGYFSGGMQLDIFLLRVALVTYGEELGTTAGEREDRRYAAQVKLLF